MAARLSDGCEAKHSSIFLELRPWLLGGLAVLGVSVLFWIPFAYGITRYLRRLTRATERIAEGHFDVSLGNRRGDELGRLGRAIERMAGRLDHLVSVNLVADRYGTKLGTVSPENCIGNCHRISDIILGLPKGGTCRNCQQQGWYKPKFQKRHLQFPDSL